MSQVSLKRPEFVPGTPPRFAFVEISTGTDLWEFQQKISLRRTSLVPLASLVLYFVLIGVEAGGFLDCHGRARIMSIVWSNLRPVIFGVSTVGSQGLVLKVPKRGRFQAAICVTTKRCDSCAQGALGRQTASRRNTCNAESLA